MNSRTSLGIVKLLYSSLAALSVLGVTETILARGFLISESPVAQTLTRLGYGIIIFLYLTWVVTRIVQSGWKLRSLIPDIFFSTILIGMFFPVYIGGSIVSFRIAFTLIVEFFRRTEAVALFDIIKLNPARILLFSFLSGIMVGAVMLMLPAATVDQRGTPFFDALFTSTSAICVTGLIVHDTGTYFTGFGQSIILILVQVGGLGIMTFSTLYTLLLGRRLGWKQEEHMREIMESKTAPHMYRLIVSIISITFLLELTGAFFLYLRFLPSMGSYLATKNAVFHSITAFCNAGFSLFRQNLMDYSSDFVVNFVIMALIIAGGLGFIVFEDIRANIKGFNIFTLRWPRLTVHTRLVVIITAALIGTGALGFFFFEFDNTMLHLSVPEKLMAALFQSVTTRTAGFNTLDFASLRDVSLLVAMLLMFIGASPASTGGGIKTTTLAVLILSARAHLSSRGRVEVYSRSIPPETIYKSIAILLYFTFFILLITILLLVTQTGTFLALLFEAVSAICTVGLSTGITPNLDETGKVLISLLMYVGRVGPLTVALALGEKRKPAMEFPTTRIVVG
ncbi:MAG: TrkH family potassium uptake protein [Candidatus Latescibacterota bacterium]